MRNRFSIVSALLLAVGCGEGQIGESGISGDQTQEGLSGCHQTASSSIPSSGEYYLTAFGAGSDSGIMSCGQDSRHGSWYYAASRQRYGCGSHIQIEANGRCVVAATDDYGPDVCVERAAGGPIIDASPLVAEHLFGTSSAGYSDHFLVLVTQVPASTPLGPCSSPTPPPPPPPPPPPSGDCHSGTLDRNVPEGTCVQSASDGAWYQCSGGLWQGGPSGCTQSYPWCHSSTLGQDVPARTCVQSRSDGVWYQCDSSGWVTPVTDGAGPVGICSTMYSL